MDKAKILAALNALQNEGYAEAGKYHDEIETTIGIVTNATDAYIAAAWKNLSED